MFLKLIQKTEHLAALAEAFSNHPIGLAITKEYKGKIQKEEIEDFKEEAGYGVRVKTAQGEILAGNEKLIDQNEITYKKSNLFGTKVYIALDGQYMGSIIVSDKIKKDSIGAMKDLRKFGVNSIVMLTGDNQAAGQAVAEELGIDKVYADLLPGDKVERLESIAQEKASRGKLVFVGDGINDAPVLARADVGVAMGGLGSDAAIEAADIVLMTDEPGKLVRAISISRKTKKIVWQNVVLALAVKGIVLIMGAMGIATMWEAVFSDVGVALLAILNSMRAAR